MTTKEDTQTRDEILKRMLETSPTKNKPLKEKESARDHDNDRDPDA